MKRGFSLLEVLLAIALIALLSGSLIGFVLRLSERRGVLLDHSRRLIGTDAVMEAIESDLFTCLAGDARRGAGVKGDATSLRILSRAVQLGMARSEARMESDDLRSTEYRFDEASGVVSAARASVLFSDEAGPSGRGGGGGREPILEGIERLRFRYRDENVWKDSFDSAAAGRLPEAIEIGLWFAPIAAPAAGEGETDATTLEPGADAGAPDEIGHLDELSGMGGPGMAEEGLPPPDRLRIIVVPDAGEGDSGGSGVEGGAS